MAKIIEKQRRLFNLYRITGWINNAEIFWIQKAQEEAKGADKWDDIKQRLQLTTRDDGLLVCEGRIQGEHPIYFPTEHQLTKLPTAHKTKHGLMAL